MIVFQTDHPDFHISLKKFASALGTSLSHDTLHLPQHYGNGYLRALRMPNGLSVCIIDVAAETAMELHRSAVEPYFFVLSFDEIYIKKTAVHIIGNEKTEHFPPLFSAAFLNSTMFHDTAILTEGCTVYSVKIIFDGKWMQRYLGIDGEDKLVKRYLALRTKKLLLEPLDGTYRNHMDELISADINNPVYFAIIENRVMLLIERFFSRLLKRAGKLPLYRIEQSDIYKMMTVEAELTKDFSSPAPTIEALCDKFDISVSKLKRQFRQVYGSSVYDYFQQLRMEKAKKLLLTGHYTIKEVGYQMAYHNISNFSRAFKKAYQFLPSELQNFRKKTAVRIISDD